MRTWGPGIVFFAASALAGSVRAQGDPCAHSTAPTTWELRTQSPLLAGTDGSATVVELREDGCVRVHLPAFRRDAGTRSHRLDPAARDSTMRRLDASGVAGVEPSLLRAQLDASRQMKSAIGEHAETRVSDEDIVELRITDPVSGNTQSIVWSSLQEDLANHPDQPSLRALDEAVRVMRALGADASGGDDAR
jgi:hypothetical protein